MNPCPWLLGVKNKVLRLKISKLQVRENPAYDIYANEVQLNCVSNLATIPLLSW